MKKGYIILLFTLFLFCSCSSFIKSEDEKAANKHKHRAVPITTVDKNSNFRDVNSDGYYFATRLGHSDKKCNGCVLHKGKMIHVDCCGYGDLCETSAYIILYNTHEVFFNAITLEKDELTDSDIFYMPERSLFVEQNENEIIWLNIPEQLSFKNISTVQFIFSDLFFSNYQVFENK